MASTLQKVQGIRALLEKFKVRARSTENHLRRLLEPREAVEWPKDADVLQIEQLVREVAQAVTGSDEVSPFVWKPAREFAKEIQQPASERYRLASRSATSTRDSQQLYEESEAEFFRGLQLWADHTSDFLEYLLGYDAASGPASRTTPSRTAEFVDVEDVEVEFDVALSYAGEDRQFARELANEIRQRNLRVFYDEYEQATLWGRDLYAHLSNVYKNKAKFCLVLVSKHYKNKLWTKHELRSAQARAFAENREYILPLRLDDTEIEGILPTTGYLTVQSHTTAAIVDLLVKKLTCR
jgi:hypothetical protein